jgi:RNA polymerase sigma-70 factor (ECF subfamily)
MDEVEVKLEELLRAGALDQAATLASEIYGFLVHLMGGTTDAGEVFSQTSEDLWRGLPRFRAQCSVRTWMYLLARHAGVRYRRTPWNRGGRTGDSKLDGLVAEVRTRTDPWLRTEVKDRWRALRESLEPDDRILLVLRVDRDLSWSDVARVILAHDEADSAELERETTRLRKRFQLLKEELRKRAREAGLVEDEP